MLLEQALARRQKEACDAIQKADGLKVVAKTFEVLFEKLEKIESG